jgi:hypothetical protein
MYVRLLAALAIVAFSSVALAQEPATAPALGYVDSFQIDYTPSLAAGTAVNLTNAGFHAGTTATGGDICVNVYTWQPDEQPRNCCTCRVSPNAVRSLNASDLLASAFGPPSPTFSNFSIKLIATRPPTGGACDAGAMPTGNGTPGGFAAGMRAWATKVHTTAPTGGTTFYTETKFSNAPLGMGELQKLVGACAFFQQFGSGAGVCSSCRLGALAVPAAVQ